MAKAALLLVDVINDLEFDGGARLLRPALRAARNIARLKASAVRQRIPVIYANDNAGHWRSDFAQQVHHCLEDGVRGKPIAELLHPGPRDYFVLKPRHSAFYGTPLSFLLERLGVRQLIIAGFATDNCVLFTANDAYLRGFELQVPSNCVAAETPARSRRALQHMREVLKAQTSAFGPGAGRAKRR